MSKATPHRATARHDSSKQVTTPAHRKPHTPAQPASTQDLIARVWDTLQWRRTLQAAFIIAVTGITAALLLTGLALAAHAMTSQAAAWPVSISITATVSYRAARHRQPQLPQELQM
jgi:hypothetical protein